MHALKKNKQAEQQHNLEENQGTPAQTDEQEQVSASSSAETESFYFLADFSFLQAELEKAETVRLLIEDDRQTIERILRSIHLIPLEQNIRSKTQTLYDFYNPALASSFGKIFRQIQGGGTVSHTVLISQTGPEDLWQLEINANEAHNPLSENPQVIVVATNTYKKVVPTHGQRESNQQFFRLLNNFQAFVYRCKLDERYSVQSVTSSVFDVTGYEVSDFMKSPQLGFVDLIHPDDLEMVNEIVNRSLTDSAKFYMEYRIITKNGGIKWVGEHCVGIRNEEGEVVAFEGSVVDITERKQVDQSLRDSRERFRRVFNFTPAAVILTDLETGIIIDANESFERILGWDKASYAGKTKEDLNLWANANDRTVFMRELKAHGLIENREFRVHHRDGRVKETLMSAALQHEQDKTLVISVWTEITRQKEFAEKLREERNFLDLVIEATPEAVCIIDKEGYVLNVNKFFAEYFGEPKGNFIGKTRYDFGPKEIAEKFIEDDRITLERNELTKTEDWISHPMDNRSMLFETIRQPLLDQEGKLIGLLAVSRDITATKAAQQELIKAKDLAEEASRLKSAFLATMSHELRTPLNAIVGFSALIEEEMPKEEIMEMVHIINESGHNLLRIIEDIFDIALLQSKEVEVTYEEFHLNSFCESLKFYLDAEIFKSEKESISYFVQETDKHRNLKLFADKNKLLQVMTNLLSNAIKYSEDGMISLTYSIEGSDLIFCVADEGIGIAPDKQTMVFERFRQVDESHTREHGGIGLGLAICKEVVDLLKGDIWVESELGKGSQFYFRIPGAIKAN